MYIYVLYEYAIEKIALYTVYRSVHNTHMLYDITYKLTFQRVDPYQHSFS